MNDIYVEWLIERKSGSMGAVLRIGAYILTGIFVLMGIFLLTPFFIPAGLMIAVDIFLLPMLNVEFEYLYMQRNLTIDKIYSKEKRKKAAEYDLDKMDIFAEEGARQLDNYKNMQLKTKDFTSGYPDRRRFVMVIHDGEERERVLLEPDEKIVDAVKLIYPSKVFFK